MLKKLNLQLLAEPAAGDPGGGQPPAQPQGGNPAPTPGVSFSPDQMAAIDKIASERSQRAEQSALRSYFQQQGLTDDQAAEAIKAYKETQKSKLSPEAAEQIAAADKRATEALNQANGILIQAEARIQASTLGIRPDRIDAVFEQAKLGEVKVKDGKVDSDSAKKALEAVLSRFPEWKVEAQQPGFRVGGDGNNNPGTDDDALRRAFGLPPKK